ncbi:MAG: TolC family protein [Acidobacteriaceae bacterium]
MMILQNPSNTRACFCAARKKLLVATFLLVGFCLASTSCLAQVADSTSNPFLGSVAAGKATAEVMHVSLNQAVQMGLENNLGLRLQQQSQRAAEGQKLASVGSLLPDITAQAETGVHQIDLVAMGFKPSIARAFGVNSFPMLIRVDVTSAQLNLSQQLFSLPAIEAYRAELANVRSARLSTGMARGTVVLTVGTAYLQVLADSSQVDNAKALLQADLVLLHQVQDEQEAGTATHLDALRAQVQYQNQQEALLRAENTLAKDKIALKREIGLMPEQPIQLTDVEPYTELATLPLHDAMQIAYHRRKDYLSLQEQVRSDEFQRKAIRYERLPSLSFNSNYGVTGETHGLYHGTFYAGGSINFPIFHEAKQRGEEDVANAQLSSALAQIADLRQQMEAQIRDSMLDVHAAAQLVNVARSNVDLAAQTLDQATQRFQAGVDDNLPVVQAQATLASAQNQLVNSLYQYNLAKLNLARNTGVIESEYQSYLGK